ncbi:MAG: hypothetical protein K0Q72_4684, partial [Armatimonadetes bacterium]|nr:hypothetical protein [Armatimonadota bacterium]
MALLVGLGLGSGLASLAAPVSPVVPKPTGEQTAFFESKIRPLLAERCYSCHGPRVRQAGLR